MYYDLNYVHQLEKNIDILNYTNAELLNVRTALMFIDAFAKNPKLHKRIRSIGYEPSQFTFFNLFHSFYSRLFKLAPHLQPRYDQFLAQTHNTKLVCVQLRFGDPNDYIFMPNSDTHKFWHFVNETILVPDFSSSTSTLENNWKLYVTSDHEFAKKEACERFGRDRVVFYDESSIHIEFDERRNDVFRFQNMVLDFHSLQMCDYAVLSHSGFGILGVANRNVPARNVWVYTTDTLKIESQYWNRKDLRFVKAESNFENIFFL